MGVVVSVEKNQSKVIDHQLHSDNRKERSTVKLLVLGTSCCGKSTVLKQMKILHGHGFNENEIKLQKKSIYQNIITSMIDILLAMQQFEIHFDKLEREADAAKVLQAEKLLNREEFSISFDLASALKKLWNDEGLQRCFTLHNVNDSTKYFFDNFDRITEFKYYPTEQDILRCRVPTTGIIEIKFVIKNYTMRMFDVGGIRSERRKWIHFFDNVDTVFFLASLADYDMVLLEDGVTNRMHESLRLFHQLCYSPCFKDAAMILFLNKIDVFAEKITTYPLTIAFHRFTGEQTYEVGLDYIKNKYEKPHRLGKKFIYTHPTCATDTRNIDTVFIDCVDIIVASMLHRSGLM